MRCSHFWILVLVASPATCQVVDVDGDKTVGPEEALAVAENWKGAASASNEHDHLGQVWEGIENPLEITGFFEDRVERRVVGNAIVLKTVLLAPLMLDNKYSTGADLRLQGISGMIAAQEDTNSSMAFFSNRSFTFVLDADQAGFEGGGSIQVRNGAGLLKFLITDEGSCHAYGNLTVDGNVTAANLKILQTGSEKGAGERVYHPLLVESDSTFLLSGKVVLDQNGRAGVLLPGGEPIDFERTTLQLTPYGAPAPNLHVAERLPEEAGFAIAGGVPGMEVAWQAVVAYETNSTE